MKNPYLKAGIVSKYFFEWMSVWYKTKKKIELEDLYDCMESDKSQFLASNLTKLWIERHKRIRSNNNLLWCCLLQFKLMILVLFFLVLLEFSTKLASPFFLAKVIDYLENSSTSKTEAYLFALGIALTSFVSSNCNAFVYHNLYWISSKLRSATSSMIYHKILKLNTKSCRVFTSGRINNMLSTDVEKFQLGIMFLPACLASPFLFLAYATILITEAKVAGVVGLALSLLISVSQSSSSVITSVLRKKVALWTDKRAHAIKELIAGVRIVKMYAWEKPFKDRIEEFRCKEMNKMFFSNVYKMINYSLYLLSGKLVAFSIILTHVLLGNDLSINFAFKIISWTETSKFLFFMYVPQHFMHFHELRVSLRRINEFLISDDRKVNIENSKTKTDSELAIKLKNGVASWQINSTDNYQFTLRNLNANIQKGSLSIVLGVVGSGKSTLLSVLLNEINLINGSLEISGSISYAAQLPWILNDTIKENIIFNSEFDKERYKRVLEVCCLYPDLEQFDKEDNTLVGERGMSLSGGQKARISLARSIYKDSDIYLFDDPLSAVDPKVRDSLFYNCIKTFLRGKTVILVTHHQDYVKDADLVFLLDNGNFSTGDKQKIITNLEDKASHFHKDDIENQLDDKENERDNMWEEDVCLGSVSWSVYWNFLKSGSLWIFGFYFLLSTCTQATHNFTDFWITRWSELFDNKSTNASVDDTKPNSNFHIAVYCLSNGVSLIMIFIASFLFCRGLYRASKDFHRQMLFRVLRAPISFFDSTPIGIILNRFTRDTGFMDDLLLVVSADTLLLGFLLSGTFATVCILNPFTLTAILPLLFLAVYYRQYSLPKTREFKRLDALARSPVYTHVSETIDGIQTIRSFNMEKKFTDKFHAFQDRQSVAWFLYISSHRWLGRRLDTMIVIFISITAFVTVAVKGYLDAKLLGLSLTYCATLLFEMQYFIRQTGEVENLMVSVERILKFRCLEEEKIDGDESPICEDCSFWPNCGNIKFDSVSLSYKQDNQPVLKNLTFEVKKGEKIGIIGRTGAGKSSLFTAILRLTEPDGRIYIDGKEIKSISLAALRQAISVIPQDPVLFSGTLRYNLDPSNEFSDEEIFKTLKQVQLDKKIEKNPKGLSLEVSESGLNFSVGERQLICLARALLKDNRIILIDEATANVDNYTDQLIQRAIRNEFSMCTVLTIAHRMNTILDSDKILILENGQILNYDSPETLLLRKDNLFADLLRSSDQNADVKPIKAQDKDEIIEEGDGRGEVNPGYKSD
ncbi:unnamed protein product [Dimorphilus gyrociliatus]|uniref:Uncharacterized protein n=1 Tax=Dimorphilus gyrociliatus TaxID=2664684 RepID=A0A7I8WAU9_9ANNE|nr:unnamed protein product [Dimorphilus gyrociliatus]